LFHPEALKSSHVILEQFAKLWFLNFILNDNVLIFWKYSVFFLEPNIDIVWLNKIKCLIQWKSTIMETEFRRYNRYQKAWNYHPENRWKRVWVKNERHWIEKNIKQWRKILYDILGIWIHPCDFCFFFVCIYFFYFLGIGFPFVYNIGLVFCFCFGFCFGFFRRKWVWECLFSVPRKSWQNISKKRGKWFLMFV
jgi:hypothetical protein